MKLIKKRLIWLMLVIGITFGCKKDDGISVALQNEVNEFVWFAMNGYYYWQADVEDLTIEKYPTYNDLYTFLNRYNQPETLFDDLLHPDDRFSWIVDDYEELEQSFQGVTKSYGYDIGLSRVTSGSDDLLAFVRYILPGGPAENAGLSRGDIFTEVNGQKLTISNYIPLLFESENMTITLSEIQDNIISTTGQDVSLVAVQLSENPILLSDVLEIDGIKVGYMVYNQFVNNNTFHQEMNDVFGTFNSEGINDFVLDLRYNGGGSLITSRILSSMIYGDAGSNDILGSIIYNNNLAQFNSNLNFFSELPIYDDNGNQISSLPMNRLNVNRVFVLTSGSSASASEFVIAGLIPYMEVTLIGTSTVGKNVGSATLYDSPGEGYQSKGPDLNPNHKYAIQPIISQLANSQGFTDYVDGLEPNIEVSEIDFLGDLKPLGSPDEALLSEALAIITGTARVTNPPYRGLETFQDARMKEAANTVLIDNKETLDLIRSQIFSGTQ